MRRRLALVMFALLGPATTARALADDKPAARPPKGGATPEESIALLKKGAAAGDPDAAFAVLADAQGKPLLEWFKGQDALAKAMNACAEAADAAFGKDDKSPIRRVEFDLKKEVRTGFDELNLTGPASINSDNRARMQIEIGVKGPDGRPFTVREVVWGTKEDGVWRLSFEQLTKANFAKGVEFMEDLRASIARTTAGIKDGTIRSRDEAVKALEKGQPRNIPANLPLPSFLTRPR